MGLSFVWIVALFITIFIAVIRLISAFSPKLEKVMLEDINKVSGTTLRIFGFFCIVIAAILFLVGAREITVSQMMFVFGATLFLLIGYMAITVEPFRGILDGLVEKPEGYLRFANIIIVVIGILILYALMK